MVNVCCLNIHVGFPIIACEERGQGKYLILHLSERMHDVCDWLK